MKATAVIQL